MAELTAADVYTHTEGRLPDDAPNGKVAHMLAAALAAARAYCGWHVSPVRTDTLVLDGPGGRLLSVPTLKVDGEPTVAEDGRPVAARWSARKPGCARKPNGGTWSGEFGAIEVTLSHGFDEVAAADWRDAICSMVEEMALRSKVDKATGRSARDLTSKKVDDIELNWADLRRAADRAVFGVAATLDRYRLIPL
ncbi:hypothetical protein [Mycolicibacterium palauense]|uniref:hypothetical protein n=1 Tax=Mycolicibacterium palauense TaxID=2034511 RepID=UPI000BFEB88E|nr:hypothetical protein [Mycolicibacterium palauense]